MCFKNEKYNFFLKSKLREIDFTPSPPYSGGDFLLILYQFTSGATYIYLW